jgi:Tfp pilus assembly protein PilV
MQGLQKLPVVRFFVHRIRLSDQRGWALVDALASAVVVVLAFTGTTMAFNGSTASVARDEKKSNAMVVAQNQINEMRSIGTRSIKSLTDMDNTTKTVTYQGVNYTVSYDSYYVTGLGSDQMDACEVVYQANGTTARYIYMRVRVTYPGQLTGATNSTSQFVSNPATLDSYYSPEGGGTQADTGTLRLYILKPDNSVATGVSTVSLYVAGETTATQSRTINAATGCVLFTGLVRNTYQVRVPVNTLQDLYLSNSATKNYVSQKIIMPDRGSLSREIRIGNTVAVTPKYYSNNGSTNFQVTGSNTNAFFNTWIAATDQVKTAPTTDYLYPGGLIFMPHADGSPATSMFPLAQGYSSYAGPCDANNPNAGVDEDINNWTQLPAVGAETTSWKSGSTGLTFSPILWLSQLRPTVGFGGANQPSIGMAASKTYYYTPTLNGAATVQVKLKGDAAGGTLDGSCKPSTTLFGTWQSLPGSLTALNTVGLPDNSMALPVGTYDVCVTVPYKIKYRSTNSSGAWTGLENTATGTTTQKVTAALPFQTALDQPLDLNWTTNYNQSQTPTNATAC